MASNNDIDELDLQSLETHLPSKDVQEAMQMAFNAARDGQGKFKHQFGQKWINFCQFS